MRKLYIVFIFSFIAAAILSYYSTFYVDNQIRRNIEMYETEQTQNTRPDSLKWDEEMEPAKPEEPRIREKSARMVDGRRFVLLETSVRNSSYTSFVESRSGIYLPLDSEYSWINPYVVDDNESENPYEINDFWFDESNKKLYLFKLYYESDSELLEIDYLDKNNITQTIVKVFGNPMFGSTRIAGFNPREHYFILTAAGGDGCGGWGNILTFNLETKVTDELLETGSGCSGETRYFTFYEDKLILGDVVSCTVENNEYEQCLTSIYSLDPSNLDNKDTIYTFSQPYLYDMGYLYGENATTLTEEEIVLDKLTSDGFGETYIFNLETGAMKQVISE